MGGRAAHRHDTTGHPFVQSPKTVHSGWLLPRTVSWWNRELSRNTTSTRWQTNQAKRMGGWESFKMALTCYNKEVREVKWSIWRNYCLGNKDVPNGARLTTIMASKSDSTMGSIKLPDGRYTQSGKKNLQELYRVHFIGSAGVEVTSEGQGS